MDMMAYACVFHKSELLFRGRFNLSAADRYLVVEEVDALGGFVFVRGPFVGAWRNLLKSVIKKGCMYKLSSSPSAVFYNLEKQDLGWEIGQDLRGIITGSQVGHCLLR